MLLRMTIFTKGLALIGIPLLFQLCFILLVGELHQESVEAEKWSTHFKEVRALAKSILSCLLEVQVTVRGFAVSDDVSQIESYNQAYEKAAKSIDKLPAFVSDNPRQKARARSVENRANWFLSETKEIAALVKAGKREKALERLRSKAGERFMHGAQKEISAFLQEEDQLGKAKEQQLEAAWNQLYWVLMIGGVASVLLTLFLLYLFTRNISSRIRRLSAKANELAQGENLPVAKGNSDELVVLDQAFDETASKLARSLQMIRLYEDIVKNVPIGLSIWHMEDRDDDNSFRLVAVNPAVTQLLGFDTQQCIGQTISEVFPKLDRISKSFFAEVVRTGEARDGGELHYGDERIAANYWAVKAFPLPKEELGIAFENVTRRKEVEQALNQLTQELEERVMQRTRQLARANQELQEKNRENEAFVYSVSHDLRSPLVNLEGFSRELRLVSDEFRQLARQNELPPPVRERILHLVDNDMGESIRFIQTAVSRLSRIIDSLLRLSRAGRVEYQWQQIELGDAVGRVVASLQKQIEDQGANIRIGDLPSVWGDATALEQLFANLIGNALNYLDLSRPGKIEIGVLASNKRNGPDRQNSFPTCYVKDNGKGIPQAYQGKIFRSFQRLHAEAAPGEGMGLMIVRRIVERHGGTIWFESTENVGTTFFVTLPTSKPAALDIASGI